MTLQLDQILVILGSILFSVLLLSFIAAFSILFISKIGLRDFIIRRSPIRLLSQLFECDFCLSFWTNLFWVVIIFCIIPCGWLFLFPIFAAPITRSLI